MSTKLRGDIEKTGNGWFYNTDAGVRVAVKAAEEGLYSNHSITEAENERGHRDNSSGARSNVDSRPVLSGEWQKVLVCLGFGTFFFIIGGFALVGFAITFSNWLLYVTGICSMAYLFLRVGIAYYVYKDAGILKHHAENNRVVSPLEGELWAPKPRFWGVVSLVMPPFAEYGPVTAYLFRRHKRIGSP